MNNHDFYLSYEGEKKQKYLIGKFIGMDKLVSRYFINIINASKEGAFSSVLFVKLLFLTYSYLPLFFLIFFLILLNLLFFSNYLKRKCSSLILNEGLKY